MSKLSSKLSKQKFAHRDITICLDGELSVKRDAAMAAYSAALQQGENDSRLTLKPGKTEGELVDLIEDEMRDKSITLRFTAVSFGEWNKYIIQNPPRKGNVQDAQLGYNSQTFFMHAARKTGTAVDGDSTEEITSDEWGQIEAALTDGDHDRIAGALIEINRREGQRGVDFLSQGSKPTRDSEETSVSPDSSE